MTNETAKLIKESFEYFDEKPRVEAFEDGEKTGFEDGEQRGIEKIAKRLKSIHTPEEISKITGLSISRIKSFK